MLISHESPICMFQDSLEYNDYDYALVHLFDKNKEYYQFFYDSVHVRFRDVLLDNSIFELKKAFDADKFAKWIENLKPTFYIVPDCLEDSVTTIDNFKKWVAEYDSLPGIKIGAVQGKTFQEIVDCYRFMADNADYIALSFDFSYYQITAPGRTKLERFANGRKKLITELIDKGIWCHSKPHHLLGASLPTEFKYYKEQGITSIRTLDTSNPVMHGLEGNKYAENLGLTWKSSQLLADNIEKQLSHSQKCLVINNIHEFRRIVNGS